MLVCLDCSALCPFRVKRSDSLALVSKITSYYASSLIVVSNAIFLMVFRVMEGLVALVV
jgi:hypothetical protein